MENAGGATEVGGYGQKMGEGRGRRQALASNNFVLTEEVFGGTGTPDRRVSTP